MNLFQIEVDMNTAKNALTGLAAIGIMLVCTASIGAAQQNPSAKVQYYPHQDVAAAFAKNAKLEVHALDTDIIYIIKGTATFVTGGKVVDARNSAPNEVRGKSSQGGTPHHLSPEDIIIIPPKVPHWFEAVQPPFLYLVVKVR
jgi:hypothetical protein